MEKLSKPRIRKIYESCLRLAKRKPPEFFNFKRMRRFQGSCDWNDISVDPRKEVLATIYHELIHYLFPNWCETQVIYAESRIRNNVSCLDHARFMKYVSIKLYKSELQRHFSDISKKKKVKKAILIR